jgi:hypothetical protein
VKLHRRSNLQTLRAIFSNLQSVHEPLTNPVGQMDAVVTDNIHLIGCLHILKSVSPDARADIQTQTWANSHLICAEVKSSLVQGLFCHLLNLVQSCLVLLLNNNSGLL